MSTEIHRAGWSIPYPADLDDKSVPLILRALTNVKHEWDAFPWQLAGRLVALLENPVPSFEYLHVTAFFRARAAMLALSDGILDPKEMNAALRRHKAQIGGIYREHLLFHLQAFLKKHNGTRLPNCDTTPVDFLHDHEQAQKNRDLIQRVIRCAEHDYVRTLNFISLATELEEEVAWHTVGFWVRGAEMPKEEYARAQKQRHDGGYVLVPTREEMKHLIKMGAVSKIVVMEHNESGRVVDGIWVPPVVDPPVTELRNGNGQRAGDSAKDATAMRNTSPVKKRKAVRRKSRKTAVIKQKAATVTEKTLAPVVEIFEKAILAATPPHKRKWWQNLRERHDREPGPMEADKWLGVSKMVVGAAIEENKKPARDRHSNYVTRLMLGRLLAKLNAPGASRVAIEADYAVTLRRYVTREEQKVANT